MRGEHYKRKLLLMLLSGIIPACAGSTASTYTRLGFDSGSSPHARGALNQDLEDPERAGIIPACAGSTRVREERGERA